MHPILIVLQVQFETMKAHFLLSLSLLAVVATAQDVSFFYFVLQWPGSYCGMKEGCCFPVTGKPATNFTIRGLWPARSDGSIISNCNDHPEMLFDVSKIEDLRSSMEKSWPSLECPSSDGVFLWGSAWDKHGTCSLSALVDGQHSYFFRAVDLYNAVDILKGLQDAGIFPDGRNYLSEQIAIAITASMRGVTPFIECNNNAESENQLFQVYLCIDASTKLFTNCPIDQRMSCGTGSVKFPSF